MFPPYARETLPFPRGLADPASPRDPACPTRSPHGPVAVRVHDAGLAHGVRLFDVEVLKPHGCLARIEPARGVRAYARGLRGVSRAVDRQC